MKVSKADFYGDIIFRLKSEALYAPILQENDRGSGLSPAS